MKTPVSSPIRSMKLVAVAILAAASLSAVRAETAAPDIKAGEARAQVCMACHVADGSRGAPAYPILQGQHAAYIVKQLTEFKSGARKNSIMNGMAAALSEDDMRNIAAFYASKSAKPGAAKDKDLVALGEKIYRGGIAAKQVPACAGCHSPDGADIPNQYPRIGSQHEDYLVSQLNNFRSGARANSAQMTAIASRLSDKEIAAVADYIAGLH